MSEILDILEKAKSAKPIAYANGAKVMSFEDAVTCAQADDINHADLGTRNVNPDGTIASMRAPVKAVNLNSYYCNRYKAIGTGKNKKIVVVRDYRAIKEQDTGTIYKKNLPAFLISRNENGELYLEKVMQVSDDDFIANFKGTIDNEGMAQLMPLLTMSAVSADALPI